MIFGDPPSSSDYWECSAELERVRARLKELEESKFRKLEIELWQEFEREHKARSERIRLLEAENERLKFDVNELKALIEKANAVVDSFRIEANELRDELEAATREP